MTGTEISTVSSSTGSTSSLPSRTEFHKDDYTHHCHPLYVYPSDILGEIVVVLSIQNFLVKSGVNLRNDMVKLMVLEFKLRKELANISQGSLDIPSYFNKIKQLWDKIASISVRQARICNCDAKGLYQEDEDEQKLYQFLVGLNDTYVQVRSHILLKPTHLVGVAYGLLLNDEKQRIVSAPYQFPSSSTSFYVGVMKQLSSSYQTHISLTTYIPSCLMASTNFADKLISESILYKSCMLSQKMPLVLGKVDNGLYKLFLPPTTSSKHTSH
ncbi:hypothetical protein KY290_005619 [Solanum tuberosum]|uniref:Uncharacterized protein n=1 Tax=Solanum tuberosum TaxID=4113 RepID=A0ABQ7WH44_SOLTU|nr:hypothetical protein KY290_005619 [Solanum tuberosum]